MELDALKEIWNDTGEKNAPLPGNAEIMEMMNKSSNGPIAKMMRNVLFEMIFIIVLFGGVAVFYFFAFKGRFSSISWIYIVLTILCTLYYYSKWKLLYNMQCVACQVKSNFKRQLSKLEKYIRYYLIAGTAIVPCVFIFLGVFFYYEFPVGSLWPILPPIHFQEGDPYVNASGRLWPVFPRLLTWAAFLSAITAFAYYGNRWFIKKLYGQHIQKLKQLLNQMEEY